MSHHWISLIRLGLVISLSFPTSLFSPVSPPRIQTPVAAPALLNVETTSDIAVPLLAGYALASLNPGVCNGNDFNSNGNSESIFENGGIFVNANCPVALAFNGQGKLATSNLRANSSEPPDGAFPITLVGNTNGLNCEPPPTPPYSPNNCNLYPPATIGATPVNPDPMANTPVQPGLVESVCNALGNGPEVTNGSVVTAGPGHHTTLNVGNKDLVLYPGVYCINSVGRANKILDARSIVGHGVLLYIKQVAASFNFAGSGVLDLSGLTQQQCAADESLCPFVNIVIYKPFGTTNCTNSGMEISFAGQADMIIQGSFHPLAQSVEDAPLKTQHTATLRRRGSIRIKNWRGAAPLRGAPPRL